MAIPQYIFYTCSEFKSKNSLTAKFLFTEDNPQVNKVKKHIENNLADFFDREMHGLGRKELYANFCEDIENYGLATAINNNTTIYAFCEEIKNIKNI